MKPFTLPGVEQRGPLSFRRDEATILRSFVFAFLLTTLSALAPGAELDAKLLPLIGENTTAVYGADLDRFRKSPLAKLFPVQLAYPLSESSSHGRTLVYVESAYRGLTIYQGDIPTLPALERRIADRGIESDLSEIAGVPALTTSNWILAIVDLQTVILGEDSMVREALGRWRDGANATVIAVKARELSKNFDNWFLMPKPLRQMESDMRGWNAKYSSQLIKAVEELSGGFRIGGAIQFQLQALTATFEDAQTLAGMGRWLPGLVQARQRGIEGRIIDAIEDLDARSSGSTAELRFTLPESKLTDLLAERQKRMEESGME